MKLPAHIFVDTAFFIALLNQSDNYHQKAIYLYQQLKIQKISLITSEYILLEFADGLSRLRYRHLAINFLKAIEKDKDFVIIRTSMKIMQQASQLYQERTDKEWGLTDCTSFVIMKNLDLYESLTTDQHFRQAGFRALMLETV